MLAGRLQSPDLLNKRSVVADWLHLDNTLSHAQHMNDSQRARGLGSAKQLQQAQCLGVLPAARLAEAAGLVPVHAFEGHSSSRVLAVEPPEDPQLEVGVHGDWHNCHKDVNGRLLRRGGCGSHRSQISCHAHR